MNYIEAVESDIAAKEAIEILLQVAEVLPLEKIIRLTQILSEGGAAYHQRNIFMLLKRDKRFEDKERIAGMFTEADYPDGFRDPRVRAALFLGLSKLIDSKGMIDAEEASKILKRAEVPETADLRDNLAAYAHRGAAPDDVRWSAVDFASLVIAGTSLASMAKKIPWARVLGVGSRLLLRK